MEQGFSINLPHHPVRFHFSGDAPLEELRELYSSHLTLTAPRLEIAVRFVTEPATAAVPDARSSDDLLVFRAERLRGQIDLREGRGEMTLRRSEPLESFGALFRVLYAALAFRAGRTFIHASASARGGAATLFVGVSGAGKSTAVRLLDNARIIHDDTVFLAADEDPVIETVPFMGCLDFIHGPSERFPVERICLLVKDTQPFLVPVSPARVLGRLLTLPAEELGRTPRAGFQAYVEASMRRCRRLAESASCCELHFTRDRLPDELMEHDR